MQRYSMGKRDKCYKREKNIHNKGVLMLYEPSLDIFKDINNM